MSRPVCDEWCLAVTVTVAMIVRSPISLFDESPDASPSSFSWTTGVSVSEIRVMVFRDRLWWYKITSRPFRPVDLCDRMVDGDFTWQLGRVRLPIPDLVSTLRRLWLEACG